MAVKEVGYGKEFLSKTGYVDISYHGSPEWEPVQVISDEEAGIRKEIGRRFGSEVEEHYELASSRNIVKRGNGFDGKQHYNFSFSGVSIAINEKDKERNVQYTAFIRIKKTGDESKLKEPCDLEKFLLEKGFKPAKSS